MNTIRYAIILAGLSIMLQSNPKQAPQQMNNGSQAVNIGIAPESRAQVAQALNGLLSNEYVLYTKTQKYHWNVVGPFFGSLHMLFGDQYAQLANYIDRTAERIRAIGFKPCGTLQEFSELATIMQEPGVNPDDTTMIRNLLDGHETIIRQLRELIDMSAQMNDMGTNNFACDLIEKHEKTAWMLRAHLA